MSKSEPRIWILTLLVVCACVTARPAQAWDPLQKAQRAAGAGQRALATGDSAVALEAMLRAQALAPRDPSIRAGLAETFYDTGNYESALRQLEPLAAAEPAPPALRRRSFYNAGNAAFRMQDLERALDLYTEALLAGEGAPDPDLLHNLELTQRLLEEQPPEQQQEPGEDGESQDDPADEQQQGADEQQSGDQDSEDSPEQQSDSREDQQEQEPESDAAQDESSPPPSGDEADEDAAQEPPPEVETMTPEEAMRLLQALDVDEEELRKSIQRRLRGDEEENEHDW